MKPTVGRIVLVRKKEWEANEFPAIVNRVWSDTCINVMAFPDGPEPMSLSSVVYTEDFDNSGQYIGWRWMPYQKAVAETSEHKEIMSKIGQ
jgi:hypothetical protein